jgi:hypothetical protein
VESARCRSRGGAHPAGGVTFVKTTRSNTWGITRLGKRYPMPQQQQHVFFCIPRLKSQSVLVQPVKRFMQELRGVSPAGGLAFVKSICSNTGGITRSCKWGPMARQQQHVLFCIPRIKSQSVLVKPVTLLSHYAAQGHPNGERLQL